MSVPQEVKTELPQLLDAKACAALAGVAPRTIKRWCQSGDFPDPVHNRPRYKRWNQADVDRWLKTGKVR